MMKQALTLVASILCTAIARCTNYTHLALLPPMKTHQYRITILAGLALLVSLPLAAQTVNEAWVRSDANGYPYGSMIAMDSQENVVVTGWRFGSYIITKKYDPDGNMLWEQHFTVPDLQAVATWVLVDPFDNIVITGYPQTFSSNPVQVGLLTIKYDSNGNLLWSDTYSGTWAFAVRGISDANGNIYVAGRAWLGTYDFVTIKYAPDGTRLWVDTFDQNSGFHTPNSMDLDSQGHLIINGGGMSGGFITVLYNTDGVRQWVLEGFGNRTTWVKLTGDGYFYLTGGFYNPPTSDDIWLLKYDLSRNLIWERHYDFGVTSEYGTMLTLDSQGNIIVAGNQSVYMHWITLKVDPQGTLLWSNTYTENPHNDAWPSFIMTGPDDEVYITGVGGPPPDPCYSFRSMATLRYNSDGSNPWTATYYPTSQRGVGLALASDNSVYVAGDYMLTVIKYTQTVASCDVEMTPDSSPVIVPPGGSFGLTGTIGNPTSAPTQTDVWVGVWYMNNFYQTWNFQNIPLNAGQYLSAHLNQNVPMYAPAGTYRYIAYCGDQQTSTICDSVFFDFTVTGAALDAGATDWTLEGGWDMPAEIPNQVSLIGSYPNPFNARTNIQFGLPEAGNVNLTIYNLMGQKVESLVDGKMEAGYHTVTWDGANYSSGIYFYKLTVPTESGSSTGDQVFTKRMTLLK